MDAKNEIWERIKGYGSFYEISNLGRIKRVAGGLSKNEKIMKPANSGLRNYVKLTNGVSKNTMRVDMLVLTTFIEYVPDDKKFKIEHINGDMADDRLENLRFIARLPWIREQNINERNSQIAQPKIGRPKKELKHEGYFWSEVANKWQARLIVNRRMKHLGYFDNEEDAREKYETELSLLKSQISTPKTCI